MLAGHCDQIGLIVQHIDDDGFLYVQPIGGWDPQVLIGQRMIVWTAGGPLPGVIARKPIHLLTEEERKQVPKMKDLWLDIGASDDEDARKAVRIGDAVTVELQYRELRNGKAVSAAMDDKAGLWVVVEALRRVDAGKLRVRRLRRLDGAGGARPPRGPHQRLRHRPAGRHRRGRDPRHRLPDRSRRRRRATCAWACGPVIHRGPNMNPKVVDRLLAAAEEHKIAYQLAASAKATGTDANAIQVNRAGVAAGLISIPNRYMHSPVETISLDDIDRAADLLARFVEGFDPDAELTP